jgi:sugar phosphate isomerase/epimerase
MSTDVDGGSPKAVLGVSARHLLGLPRVMGLPPDFFVRPGAAGDDEVSEWTALRCLAIRSLELMVGLDPEEADFFDLAAEALGEGFDLSFHSPSPDDLDLREFAGGDDRVGKFYQAWLRRVARLPIGSRRPVLVVHGVNAPGTGPEVVTEARTTTVAFLRWLASACAEQAVRMQMAFELRPRREGWTKVGGSCAEVLAVVEEVGLPEVGICWDVGHGIVNLLRRDDGWPPPRAFLERTVHTHLHRATAEEDHFPITSPTEPLREALAVLARAGYQGVLNLECHFARWEEVARSAELVSRLWDEVRERG